MNRKGEETSPPKALAGIILGLVVFVILIVFAALKLAPEILSNTEQEACKVSILARATTPESAKEETELKCTTENFCVSIDNEECKKYPAAKKVKKENLPADPDAAANALAALTANEMYDCWKLAGSGRYDIFGNDGSIATNLIAETFTVEEVKPKCIVCSRIILSQELKDNKQILDKVDVNRYIAENQAPNSELTYLNIFTDRQVKTYPKEFQEKFQAGSSIFTDDMAVVFVQMIAKDQSNLEAARDKGANTGIAIAGGLLSSAGTATISVLGAKLTAITAVTGIISSAVTAGISNQVNRNVIGQYCGKLESSQGDKYGCSLVTTIDFNQKDKINLLCNGGIESQL